MNIRSAIAAMLIVLSVFLTAAAKAQTVETDELIRASIIEKIAYFIEWPNWKGNQFTLCVIETTALLPALRSYYETVSIANRPVSIVLFHNIIPLDCQAVFIGEEDAGNFSGILKMTHNVPALVIAEKKGAVNQGVHVDFFTEDNRLHLEVNRKSLEASGLKVSYHLLKVARIVE